MRTDGPEEMTTGKPVRRSQESRSAETRDKVLKATIQSLFTRGYSATALFNVAAEAGVSRGAAQHQFPTKIDLMLYVVSTVYAEEKAIYQAKLAAIADPRERLLAFPDIAWDVLSRPEGVAVLEIMQGSRSDPELSAQLRPLQQQIERDSIETFGSVSSDTGLMSDATAIRLFVWAIRGLSIAQLVVQTPDEVRKSVRLLRHMLKLSIDEAERLQRT